MRLHSVTNTLENGFVYLPSEAAWLAAYLHEITVFPGGKYDDQADSTSQALDWMKQTTCNYGFLEYIRQEELRARLGLSSDYRFTQFDEDEEIIAAHKTTGYKIRWNGSVWVDVDPEQSGALPTICPACQAKGAATYGNTHRCNQCRNRWPRGPQNVPQGPTPHDILNGIGRHAPTRIISWRFPMGR